MIENIAAAPIIFYLLIFCAGLFVFRNDKIIKLHGSGFNRNIDIYTFLIFLLIWIFAISIRDSYDISFYKYAYEERIPHGKEPLFDALQFLCHDSGLSFDLFRMIWVTIVVLLLYHGIQKYTDHPRAVIALSLLTPFTAYVTQMRNAMVAAIMINAFQLLFTGRKKDRLIYFIVVLLCAQLHVMAYVYLIFLLLRCSGNRVYNKRYFLIIGIVTVLALGFSALSVDSARNLLLGLPLPDSIKNRLFDYIGGEKTSLKSAIAITAKYLFMFILTDRACKLQMKDFWNADRKHLYSVIAEMNIMMLIFLPVTIINQSFERIFNCFIMIQYAMIFNVQEKRVGLSNMLSVNISMKTLLVAGIIVFTFISIKTNPHDFVRLINSLGF